MNDFKVREWKLEELKDRRIWIPRMCDAAFILAAAMRSRGYDSQVLPSSGDLSFSLGRKYADGDQCLPSVMTTEDMIARTRARDFNKDKEAFFQGKSEGPCRFGRYYMNQQAILYDLGLGDVPILTLDSRNAYGGLGKEVKILAWDGMVVQALLERSVHFTRPVELELGESERVYHDYLHQVCELVESGIKGRTKAGRILKMLRGSHLEDFRSLATYAAAEFAHIPTRKENRPKIFITGEIYVRTNQIACQDLVKRIEKLGGIAVLEPITSFFGYVNELKTREAERNGGFLDRKKSRLETWVMNRDEHLLGKNFESVLGEFAHDPNGTVVMNHGSKYVHPRFKGETIVSLGASDYYADKVDGVINTYPFACLPGTLVKSMSSELRANNNGIPFLNLPFDGHPDPNMDDVLGVFMYQVRERSSHGVN